MTAKNKNIDATELYLRQSIIDHCLEMNKLQINQGTSGNISLRHQETMLITPSAIPYAEMTPDMIVRLPLYPIDKNAIPMSKPNHTNIPINNKQYRPSSEWQLHRDILHHRPEINAIIHSHPPYCTALAIGRLAIPAVHYMIAIFGGSSIRCADYATFSTEALSQAALTALEERTACLLANHGMITIGTSLPKTLWAAGELEVIARNYYLSLGLKTGPVLLSEHDIEDTKTAMRDSAYGLNAP